MNVCPLASWVILSSCRRVDSTLFRYVSPFFCRHWWYRGWRLGGTISWVRRRWGLFSRCQIVDIHPTLSVLVGHILLSYILAVTKQSPLKEKVASPVKAKPRPLTLDDYRRSRGLAVTAVPAASPEPVVSTSNPTIRKLGFDVSGRVSNEKYLKTGLTTSSGIKSSKSCSKLPHSSEDKSTKDPRLMQTVTASLKPFPKLIPVGTAHPTTAKDKEIKRLDAPLRRTSSAPIPLDTLKAMPLPLQQPPNTLYNKASQKVLRESHSNSVMAEVEVKAVKHSMEELVNAIVLGALISFLCIPICFLNFLSYIIINFNLRLLGRY